MQFIDLAAQQARIKDRIDSRIQAVLAHGGYIMGPEVKELESQLAAFSGVRHALGCANGTDALQLALMALGASAGDAVFCPTFTFAATAEIVPLFGAKPVFVDVLETSFNMDPASLERAIAEAKRQGLRPAGIIPVDLFGLPADYDAIEAIAEREGIWIVADSAQGYGGLYKGRRTGSIGTIATTSFFPAKPLGCYGDGGAVFTNDDELAKLLDSLRVHGKGSDKYDNVRIGLNSRLDTLQAAILLEKLAIYKDEIESRQRVAQRYNNALANHFAVPVVPEGTVSVWAQYTLLAKDTAERDAALAALKAAGIPGMVYYPRPLHTQTAYQDFPKDPKGLPVAESLAGRVFSLPMHPYLTEADQDRVINALREAS
ncbi:DegT/DnrJ/EryC1/StrS aminotransferase family protein [Pseudomonas sp. GX19020]|uniref:DegT/DnrJ/EryC1/StrS family aminotransferase n=1 Tax=Pseudomonas sp. GX19020 TaxID=2942277 RepID=UPI00201A1324|nr:DegT/DnrJ/EryC1/StrS aminotransferase family protein [Pseudomonas sp. GX19020]MCL4067782.1 DegT/DnrJ/EryC1/StrS aminotransferase family protein [Pseudomonas sp. GX19020]